MADDVRKFTLDELAYYNGENGRPAYVAYRGKVVDVSTSRLWRGGGHMRRHRAGEDLTDAMEDAPHDTDVLDRFPQVGVLATESALAGGEPALPDFLERLFERFPRLRRHPHPMTVHFPIVFMIFAPLFTLAFLVVRAGGLELAGVYCLALGLLFTLIAVPTGFLTWWVNYMAHPMPAVIAKIYLSSSMFVLGLGVFLWRLLDPTVAYRGTALYFVLFFLLFPMPFALGILGASLSFPVRRERSMRDAERDPADPAR